MNKRYISRKHYSYNKVKGYHCSKKKRAKQPCSYLILRVNICLGIAIAVVGLYRTDSSGEICRELNRQLQRNTSIEQISGVIEDCRLSGGESVVLDDEVKEEIERLSKAYTQAQKEYEKGKRTQEIP